MIVTDANVPSAESVKAYVDANVPAIADNSGATSGYVDVGNMRIQWGNQTYTGGQMLVTMPAAFANTTFSVVAQTMYDPGNASTTGGARGASPQIRFGCISLIMDLLWVITVIL